jgi:L-2-hydroxyglutarate oxidase
MCIIALGVFLTTARLPLETQDVVIIGGGIVGLATGWALMAKAHFRLSIIEAEDHLAAHQSGHNSGVIHSGIYYRPGSEKAARSTTGREAMYRFCAEHGIAHERCGKIVIAAEVAELAALEELQNRGRANGLTGIRRLSAQEIQSCEPCAGGIAGLYVPDTGIVDYAEVSRMLGKLVREPGGRIELGRRFLTYRADGPHSVLETNRGDVRTRFLINCGGLWADRIARRCHVQPGATIVPFRGEYYQLVPARAGLVRNLIYPVPDPRLPFLGVHFTRTIHGAVEAGPNAVLALARGGYCKTSFNLRDAWEMATNRGLWQLSAHYWRTGMEELWRSWSKRAFVKALKRLVPAVEVDDVQPAGTGVRAQALSRTGRLLDDFHIVRAERMIHVINAPSPAATASLTIGRAIADMAADSLAR